MRKIVYLYFIMSFLIYGCKQSASKDKNNPSNTSYSSSNSNPLKGLVLLGVEKTDSLYTVNNRCDGGYAVFKMFEKEFYYYHPQEGAIYSIKKIIKKNNNNYNIITNGYYYFKGDKLIPQENSWILNKKKIYYGNLEKKMIKLKTYYLIV